MRELDREAAGLRPSGERAEILAARGTGRQVD